MRTALRTREYTFDNCSDDMNRAGDHSDETSLEMFTFDAANPHIPGDMVYRMR